MNRRDEKKKAWEEWHFDMHPEDIPMMNASFEAGFDSAWDAMRSEISGVLQSLDTLEPVFGSAGVYQSCIDRLRALTEDQP